MTITLRPSYRQMTILIFVFGLLTGCASVFQDIDNRMHQKRFESDYAALENTLSVYNDGDYVQALSLFKTLSAASTNEKLARKAWMGEACCLLMLADTQSDYAAAMDLWRDVRKSTSENDDTWDLVLLDPLIARMTPKTHTRVIEIHPPPAPIPPATRAPAGQARSDQARASQQLEDQQVQTKMVMLEKKAAEAEQLQHELDEVVAENRSLKEKIKALEAIDQNIQKKKTEIAAPGE